MTEVGFRDLGTIVPGPGSAEPAFSPASDTVRAATPAAQSPSPAQHRIFTADLPDGSDALEREGPLNVLAELAAHSSSETPLCIGLLGGPGSGKSFAMTRLLAGIERVTSAAAAATERSPFVTKIFTRRIDAAGLDGDLATALAAELHAGLAKSFPDLAREATHAVRDPRIVAREAGEQLDEARRRLETERRALDEADSRRARLTETVLYETAGSQIDAYARTNRARIETSLHGFGITGDSVRNYKDIVRGIVESGGTGGKLGIALRAFWAFKGQTRLIVIAILLLLVGIGLGAAVSHQATWLTWLRTSQESFVPIANWFQAHMDWIAVLQDIAWLGAAVAILVNIWRAIRFLQPTFRGVSLLRGDLVNRRRDLDAGVAYQTRRVDGLAADVEAAARRSTEAERRASTLGPAAASLEPPPFEMSPGWAQAQSFIASLNGLIATARRDGAASGSVAIPQRIVVALDNLDAVAPPRAREILDSAHRLLTGSFVTLIAADPYRLASGSEGFAHIEKWIQVPFRLDKDGAAEDYVALVRAIIGHADQNAPLALKTVTDARKSAFDRPISEAEANVLSSLAPLAGSSPRAVKRFVNLYRIARIGDPEHPAGLALMLALDAGGTSAEIGAMAQALATAGTGNLDLSHAGPRLGQALKAVQAVEGPLTGTAARHAAALAATFSLRP